MCRLEIESLNLNLRSDDRKSFSDLIKTSVPSICGFDRSPSKDNSDYVAFNVHTYPEGFNHGLTFSFRAESADDCTQWIGLLQSAATEAKRTSPKVAFFRRYQVQR